MYETQIHCQNPEISFLYHYFLGVHFIFAIYYDCKRLFGQLYRTLSNLEKATKAAEGISR